MFDKFQVGDLIRLKQSQEAPSVLVVKLGSTPDQSFIFDPELDRVVPISNAGYMLLSPASMSSLEEALKHL